MTYSTKVKIELSKSKFLCEDCYKAFMLGFLLCHKKADDKLCIAQDSKQIADFLAELMVIVSGIVVSIHTPDLRNRNVRPSYFLVVQNKEDIEDLYNSVNIDSVKVDSFTLGLKSECCRVSFMRGVFFGCGTMSDPKKEYDFEIVTTNSVIIKNVLEIMKNNDINLKTTTRKNKTVLYAKDSQQIEDILTVLGATKISFDLMNTKIEKELRNKVNRVTNCETANITKTVNAALNQIEAINYIYEKKGKDYLNAQLQEIAQIRLENPEISLNEFCDLISEDISRSGVNHRLSKICKIAQKLREE